MITKTHLRKEHERNFDGRPKRIQRLRHPLRVYCGVEVPRSVADVDEWYSRNKGTITRRLNGDEEDE